MNTVSLRPLTPLAASSASPQSRLRLRCASLPDDDDASETSSRHFRDRPLGAFVRVPYGVAMTRESDRDRIGGAKQQTAGAGDQPRPAFGLRPWFALLRRARSLRRFAFAIVRGSVPGDRRYRSRRTVVLASEDWRSPPVSVASSFADRLFGIRREGTDGLLIRCSSVHGFGIRDPLRVVHLDGDGTVVHQDILVTGRRSIARGVWTLELPIGVRGPATGARLVVLPSFVV
jgi:hypothetical protein